MIAYKTNKTLNIHFFNSIIFANKFQITSLSQIITILKLKKHYQSLNEMECTIFLVSQFLANTNKLDSLLPTGEQATYNCICSKYKKYIFGEDQLPYHLGE